MATRKPRLAKAGLFFDQRIRSAGTPLTIGTVKFFNANRGFGFIAPEDGSKDAFVHISAVERAGLTGLTEGQRVEYELQPGRDGKSSAEDLKLLD